MLLSEAILKRINFYLEKDNLKPWNIYTLSGIPKSTVYAYINSKAPKLPSIKTLHHICEALGITIKEFFSDPMFEETEQD